MSIIRKYAGSEKADTSDTEEGKHRLEKKWFVYAFLGVGIFGIILLGYIIYLSRDLPSPSQLENYQPRLITHILGNDGSVIKELYTQKRFFVPLDSIPTFVQQAVIATEDRKFYDHWGINLLTIGRAFLVNVTSLGIRQGASTITQQLARNLYLTFRQTLARKIRETLTAIEIERAYSKREILEMYLTQTYFGSGVYGIGAAAMKYFSKPVQELTVSEAATLIGILKAPTHYNPIYQPEACLARRDIILRNMRVCDFLTEEQYQHAVQDSIKLAVSHDIDDLGIAPYFTEMVRQELEDRQAKYGFDYYRDGLTVETTLNPDLQRFAELAMKEHLAEWQPRVTNRYLTTDRNDFVLHKYPNADPYELYKIMQDSTRLDSIIRAETVVQVAFVALDPETGDILAMIGGRNFRKYKFNRAVQSRRQPGSTFKPFAYIAAIDNGYPLTTRLWNTDVVATLPGGKRWTPPNFDGSRGGLTTLREGIQHSINLVSVRLVLELTKPIQVVTYAHQMGIESPLDTVSAIVLGCTGVTPMELTSAYSALAARGLRAEPIAIKRIIDRHGNIVEDNSPRKKVVLSEETAYLMTSMLESAINRGTGGSARWKYGFRAPAAGKTGTTNEFTDAWFVGYTPQLVAGVWVGLDDPGLSLGKGATGSSAALPIWARFMKMAYDSLGYKTEDFEMPAGVVEVKICKDSYTRASQYCPNTYTEVFLRKNQPREICPIHSRVRTSSR
jgi:penicillin-binding protein 1A